MTHLLLALGAMFLQQTFVSLGRALPAVIAPAIIADLLIDPAWVGIYFGLTAFAALLAQLGCGSFIVRYGALRMSQVALFMYLTTIGYTLVAAGFVFSAAVAVAVPGRIVWGLLGSGYVAPRLVMAGLALGMAGSAVLLGLCSAAWPTLLVGVVAGVLSATALSWHGILLAETARAAPEGMRGAVTGGVLSFGQFGALTGPMIYSGLLGVTGSYSIGFIVCGIPALLVGVNLVRQAQSMEQRA